MKEAEVQENRERVGNALRVFDKLESLIHEGNRIGKTMIETVDSLAVPLTVNQNETVYQLSAQMFSNVAAIYSALIELAREAKVISKLSFMKRLAESDPQSAEIVSFFADNYNNGKLNLKDLPIFISLYGPSGKDARRGKEYASNEVDKSKPLISKAKKIGQNLYRPRLRITISSIRKSLINLAEQSARIEQLDDDTINQMFVQSPDWLKPLIDLSSEAKDELDKAFSKQPGFR